jgi:hypothetical protein
MQLAALTSSSRRLRPRRLLLVTAALAAAFAVGAGKTGAAVTPVTSYFQPASGGCFLVKPGAFGGGGATSTITAPAQKMRNANPVRVTLREWVALLDDYDNVTWTWIADQQVDSGQIASFPEYTQFIPDRSTSNMRFYHLQLVIQVIYNGQVFENLYGTVTSYNTWTNSVYGAGRTWNGVQNAC